MPQTQISVMKPKSMKIKSWSLIWVEDMPEKMKEGEIYISPKHRLTEHMCACGCGAEVSLPLGRSDWKLYYDGETISLFPSVGNWRLLCQSHYVIENSRTRWCRRWSEDEIMYGRTRDWKEKLKDIKKSNRGKRRRGRILRLIDNLRNRRY